MENCHINPPDPYLGSPYGPEPEDPENEPLRCGEPEEANDEPQDCPF